MRTPASATWIFTSVELRALVRRVRRQESSTAQKHPVATRMAPLDNDAILEFSRLACHADCDFTRAERPTMQQSDTMATDLTRHCRDRVSAGRGNLGGDREFKTIRRSSMFHIGLSDAFQDATEVPKCWSAPGISRHRVIVFFVVIGLAVGRRTLPLLRGAQSWRRPSITRNIDHNRRRIADFSVLDEARRESGTDCMIVRIDGERCKKETAGRGSRWNAADFPV